MNLLLDTHVLLALLRGETGTLGAPISQILAGPHRFVVSVASLWEIAIKRRLGKLELFLESAQLPQAVASLGVEMLAIEAAHVMAELETLPATRDPFDRLLLAQCQIEGLRLVTIDRALVDHPLAWRPGK